MSQYNKRYLSCFLPLNKFPMAKDQPAEPVDLDAVARIITPLINEMKQEGGYEGDVASGILEGIRTNESFVYADLRHDSCNAIIWMDTEEDALEVKALYVSKKYREDQKLMDDLFVVIKTNAYGFKMTNIKFTYNDDLKDNDIDNIEKRYIAQEARIYTKSI